MKSTSVDLVLSLAKGWGWSPRPLSDYFQQEANLPSQDNQFPELAMFSSASGLLLSLLPEMPFPTQFYSLNWSSSITCSKKPSLITRPTQTVLSAQFSSVAQSCPTLCDPMNCSTPGLPVHHHLPEFTHSDAIQPSHPRSSPSPPAPNPSQHQSLFQ